MATKNLPKLIFGLQKLIFSLFLASSHNFISSHFYIKYLIMSNNIAAINQEEFEPSLLPNPNLTMAIPSLANLLVAQFPKRGSCSK
jgi:hypothetical protein